MNVEYGEFKIEVIVNEIPSVDYTYEIIFYKYMESYFYDDIDEVIAKITNELEGVEVE